MTDYQTQKISKAWLESPCLQHMKYRASTTFNLYPISLKGCPWWLPLLKKRKSRLYVRAKTSSWRPVKLWKITVSVTSLLFDEWKIPLPSTLAKTHMDANHIDSQYTLGSPFMRQYQIIIIIKRRKHVLLRFLYSELWAEHICIEPKKQAL